MSLRFFVGEWCSIVLVVSIVLVCLGFLGLRSLNPEKDRFWKYSVYLIIIFMGLVTLPNTSSICLLEGRYTYVKDMEEIESNAINVLIPFTSSGYTVVTESQSKLLNIDVSDNLPYDRVYFNSKCKKLSFIEFVRGLYDYSIWLDVEIRESTKYTILQGSSINIVSDVNVHYVATGGKYYSDTSYIRYNNEFFRLGNISKDKIKRVNSDFIDSNKSYILIYDELSKDIIADITGYYTSYNHCSLVEYK